MTNTSRAVDFGLLKPIMRANFVRQHGLQYSDLRHGEDFEFYLRGLRAGGRFCVLPKAYYLYTERDGRVSKQNSGVSRTAVNYQRLQQASLQLAEEPGIRNDSQMVRLLLRRAKKVGELHARHALRSYWNNRKISELSALLWMDSTAVRVFLKMTFNKLLADMSERIGSGRVGYEHASRPSNGTKTQ
jgi:hypothetical protein